MKTLYTLLLSALLGLFAVAPLRADEATGKNIGVFGDSLGDGVWFGLYDIIKKHPENKLFRHAKAGTGLVRSDFADWMKEFTGELDSDKIDTVVVMFGANDEQGIRDENHKGYTFKSEGWKRTYSARIDTMYAEFEKRKVKVFWVGLPIMRSTSLNSGALFLNDLFAGKAKEHNATFIPLMDDFKGTDGNFETHYTDEKGKSHLLRAEDGVHFSSYGYVLIAEKVFKTLSTMPVAATPAPVVPAAAAASMAAPISTAPVAAPTPVSPGVVAPAAVPAPQQSP